MKDLSLVDPLTPEYEAQADQIYDLPGCVRVVGLPDAGMSNHETPYGLATAFDGYVVPQLLGRVVSCGMALIEMGVGADVVAPASHVLAKEVGRAIVNGRSRASLDKGVLEGLSRYGPSAVVKLFPELSERVDDRLLEPIRLDPFLIDVSRNNDIIPPWVRRSGRLSKFPGAFITKNHFIEIGREIVLGTGGGFASVDDHTTFCAYHFETPLSGPTNGVYSGTRRKERENGALNRPRTWLQMARKACFHTVAQPRNTAESWRSFLRHRDFVPIKVDSAAGQRYLSAVQFLMNYERAGRLVFALILMQAVKSVLGRQFEWKVRFEANHNGFDSESVAGRPLLVSRKNLVRADSCEVGFIAGMYNIPSLVVEPTGAGGGDRWMNSFDHGIGNHLWRDTGEQAYRRALDAGDVSQYERSLRSASTCREPGKEYQRLKVGECAVYRISARDSRRDSTERHDVMVGPALQHVLRTYSQADCPVRVRGLLSPILNVKESP